MLSESEISRELQAFGPDIIAYLDSMGFWDLPEGPYDPVDIMTSAPASAKREYLTESKKKNSRVWDLVKALFVPVAIGVGIATIQKDYKPQLARQVAKDELKSVKPSRPTAQDYQNQYIRERGGEFITKMSRADQQQLTRFLWKNAGEHERPLAKRILKQEPTLAYLVDNKEYRLRMIKRTETHRATMYGSWKYSADWGAETKTRGEAGDGRTRPSHRAQIGITVLINEPYPDGEQYPGEMSINCRGHNIFNFDKSKLTKDPQKVYESNLASAEEDARIARKAEREATKVKPVEIQKAKPIGGEVIPRKVAPKSEPRKIAKLTEDEKYSVEHYASDGFLDTNKYLRGQKGYRARDDDIKKNVARLDSAIEKSTVPKCTVYRGFESSKIYDNLDNLKGAVIDDKAFVSTSLKKDVGNFYATGPKNMVIEISVPDGAKALDLKGLATNKAESEILLPRNSKFRVIESSKLPNGQGYIKAVLVQ